MENQSRSGSLKRRTEKNKRSGYRAPRLVRYGNLKELTRGGPGESPCLLSKDVLMENQVAS